jgi:hypothetical protein
MIKYHKVESKAHRIVDDYASFLTSRLCNRQASQL